MRDPALITDGVGEEYYVTNDENYLIASSFEFDTLDDNHCYQSLYIFYIGTKKPVSYSKEQSLHQSNKNPISPCVASIMVVESLAIWCESTGDKTFIYTLG
jgi:hypothetical protein